MSSWSKRRRLLYATVIGIVIIGAVIVPAFFIFYHAPTCSDGVKNGAEEGVDCGGACERLCQSSFLPPKIAWTRLERLTPTLYNVASYVINANTAGEARNVPYKIELYDDTGTLIEEVNSRVTIPPHRNTLAYIPAIDVGKRPPARAVFEGFTASPDWHKRADPLRSLEIGDKNYTEDPSGSSLMVTLKNSSVDPLPRMDVYAILSDSAGNVIGFSKTIVDGIIGKGTAVAPFTWSEDRHGKVISIEVLPMAE